MASGRLSFTSCAVRCGSEKRAFAIVTVASNQREELVASHSASLIDTLLEKAKQLSYFVCDAYLRLRGIRDDLPPSITVVIPTTERTERITETIESLLSARYVGLCTSLVGPVETAKITN